jgi:hypothetical protein
MRIAKRRKPCGHVRGRSYVLEMTIQQQQDTWIPITRSEGPSWTMWDVAAMIGDVHEVDWHGAMGFDRTKVRVLEGRLTSDPRRAEFRVVPV